MQDSPDDKIFSEASAIELQVYECLKKVIDPEVGLNIIDMGLVYTIQYRDAAIYVEMTLTSKGCPLGASIRAEMEKTLSECFPAIPARIELVWEPAWNTGFISAGGRKALGY
jgi:metal-sulfur cluster biosynthetic enzyme